VPQARWAAILHSGIKKVENLSSNGCQVTKGNSVIEGLSYMEARLNELESLNMVHLRPTFYIENFFMPRN
jgi:hypothetical protein